MTFVYPDADPGYEDDPPTDDELEAWDASDRQDALHATGFYDEVVAENREAATGRPPAAHVDPPAFPFRNDRHVYGDRGPLMAERLADDEPSEADLARYYNHEGGEDPVTRQQIRDAGRPGL